MEVQVASGKSHVLAIRLQSGGTGVQLLVRHPFLQMQSCSSGLVLTGSRRRRGRLQDEQRGETRDCCLYVGFV